MSSSLYMSTSYLLSSGRLLLLRLHHRQNVDVRSLLLPAILDFACQLPALRGVLCCEAPPLAVSVTVFASVANALLLDQVQQPLCVWSVCVCEDHIHQLLYGESMCLHLTRFGSS